MQNLSRWSIKSLFAAGAVALAGTVMAASPMPSAPAKATASASTSSQSKTREQLEASCKANAKSADCKELNKLNHQH